MSWVSGSPAIPPSSPKAAPEEGGGGTDRRSAPPLAWVPWTSGLATEDYRSVRLDGLAFLVSGVAYLMLGMLLIVAGRTEMIVAPDRTLPAYFEALRDLTLTAGWLGFTASGLLLFLLPAYFGIPYRPVFIARLHLLLANAGLLGFAVASLGAASQAWASGFLLLLAASYLIFAVPLALVLILALEDWLAGKD